MRTLLLPAKPDPERDAVARAWEARFGPVLRLDRFWEPPALGPGEAAVYGNDAFCLVLAQKLGLTLLSPPDDLLLQAGPTWLRRQVRGASLGEALAGPWPGFVKPLTPKAFRAGVWPDAGSLAQETSGLGPETPVLVSEVVRIAAEARAWVLEGQVRTCAVYEGQASADDAAAFLGALARAVELPSACVLDAALLDGGWALLEANAAWGAGLNGCDPAEAALCIERASR